MAALCRHDSESQVGKRLGLPQAIRTDNGKELCGRAMLTWKLYRGVKLFLMEPSKRTRVPISSHSMGSSEMSA